MTTETEQVPAGGQTAVPFRAEVRQLLHILAHSLYTDRETFLRELISNASDALYRVQFEMLTNREVQDPEAELAIRLEVNEQEKTITISDSGIGMTREELVENLGTIAHSGARAILEKLEAGQRGEIIGQFGVGFYSAFVVADEVTVISRSYRPGAEAAQWRSSGGESFTVAPAEREQRGTSIILKLKPDAEEFASSWRLRQIIKRHSDFVAFPISIGDERVNQQTALWRQQARQVETKQYAEFYRQMTLDFEEPLLHMHLSSESPVDMHAILFVPGKRERGIIERRTEGRIKLYSRKVLIQEEAANLLPGYLRFIEGVVDSDDLPLNVSREGVQSSPVIERIRKALSGRLTKELAELAEKEPEKYRRFWDEFGIFLKEGIATEAQAQKDLLPLLRFHSTAGEELVSLADYKSRLAEGQQEIYYVLGADLESARRSPHLDPLRERGLEALLLVDMVDGFMLSGLREYEGHKLRNVNDPTLQLPGEAPAHEEQGVEQAVFERLAERVRQVLGERVSDVRASTLLRSSPVRLVSPQDDPRRDMEHIQRMLDRDYKLSPRMMELNRSHQLVVGLAGLLEQRPDDALINPLIEQLYESALLLEGLHPNPAGMVERIQLLMEAAVRNTQAG